MAGQHIYMFLKECGVHQALEVPNRQLGVLILEETIDLCRERLVVGSAYD